MPSQSDAAPEKIFTIEAVASASPSMIPIATMDAPIVVARYTGSRAWIISEETSMSSDTKPSVQTAAGMARSVATPLGRKVGGGRPAAGSSVFVMNAEHLSRSSSMSVLLDHLCRCASRASVVPTESSF